MAAAKKAAAKKAAEKDEERDFGQAQPPGHVRVEVSETVSGVDGEVSVETVQGVLSVKGEATFDLDGVSVLVQALDRARHAL